MTNEWLKILYGIEASIIKKEGSGISGRIYFKAVSNEEVGIDLIYQVQTNLGYHPAGYDSFGHSTTKIKNIYFTTWSCSTSCD